MGEGRGKLVFHESQPKESQFSFERPPGSSFFSCTKSRNTLSEKHSQEPQECSVAAQELQEGVPGWWCFCPSASSQLLSQAGRQEVMGSQQDRHGKNTAKAQRHPCTAKHRVTLEKDKKG